MKSLRLIENKRCENGEIWKLVLNPIHNLKQWNVFNGNKNVSLGNSVWRLQRVETLGIRIHGARSSSLTAQFRKSKIRFLKNINRFQILIYVTLLTMIVWRNPDILIYWLLLKTCCMNMSVSSPLEYILFSWIKNRLLVLNFIVLVLHIIISKMKYRNKRRLLILNFIVLVMHIIISKMKYDKKNIK